MTAARPRSLDGIVSPEDQKIERLAMDYVEVRDKRMELTKEEVERRDDLIEAMTEAKRESYERGDVKITLDHKTKVKVSIAGDPGEPE